MLNIILLGITSLLTDVSSEMVYPLIPLYLTSAQVGATPAIVGLIEGIAESLASLLRVFSGYWSDRVRERKPLTLLGYAASAVGKALLYISNSWPLVLSARLTDRFGKGIRTAPRDALIIDSADPDRRGNAFGLHRALDSAGASLGVMLAYFFFVSSRDSFSDIFALSIIPALLGVVVLVFVRERTARRPRPSTADGVGHGSNGAIGLRVPWWQDIGPRWQALDTRLKLFLGIVFIFALGNSSNQFLLLRAKNEGYDDATVILLYLVFNLVYAAASWPAGRLSDRVGRKALLVLGYLTYGVVYLGFALANPLQMWGLFATYGLYIAFTEGVEKALVADIAPADLRATLIGLHATFVGIGLLPASLLAGFLWDTVGPAAPFYFGGGLGLVAAIALWRLI